MRAAPASKRHHRPGQRVASYDDINIGRTPFSNELHLTELSLWARDLHLNSFSLFVSPCNISMSDTRQMRINPLWPNSSASFSCEWLRLKLLRLLPNPQRSAPRKPLVCVDDIDALKTVDSKLDNRNDSAIKGRTSLKCLDSMPMNRGPVRGTRKVLPGFGGQRCLPGWAGGKS